MHHSFVFCPARCPTWLDTNAMVARDTFMASRPHFQVRLFARPEVPFARRPTKQYCSRLHTAVASYSLISPRLQHSRLINKLVTGPLKPTTPCQSTRLPGPRKTSGWGPPLRRSHLQPARSDHLRSALSPVHTQRYRSLATRRMLLVARG